jgi:mRNA interferase RelE/StbE
MFRIEYSRDAQKALTRLPRNLATLIRRKIEGLAADPFAANNNVKRLKGGEGYRLRVGDWRVIYLIDAGVLVIVVVRIGPRGSVYED